MSDAIREGVEREQLLRILERVGESVDEKLRALGDEVAVQLFALAHVPSTELTPGERLLGDPRGRHRRRSADERPSTPDMAAMKFVSMAIPTIVLSTTSPKAFESLSITSRSIPWSAPDPFLDGPRANQVMHEQHAVQLFETDRIGRAAHRRIVVQDAVDDAGIEEPYLTQQSEPSDLPVELVEILRPPSDLEVVWFRRHASLPADIAGAHAEII